MAHGRPFAGSAGSGRSGRRAVEALTRPAGRSRIRLRDRPPAAVPGAGPCGEQVGVVPPRPVPGLEREALAHPVLEAAEHLLDPVAESGEVECVTGDDCFVLKVTARSTSHLEAVSGKIGALGSVTTSAGYSSPLPRRAVSR
ncbi:Lrp/AsnC ligand binding domain-containing protein [Streptomyces sp. NPDC058221]|uniref:Lrp/AsnC ligand binding domain-containing protein n=1 Tax=Streptomyces sp. NPDC058221 TaxID=3346388 RepID=UPI0036E79C69